MPKKLFTLFLTLCVCLSSLGAIPSAYAEETEEAWVAMYDYDYDGTYIYHSIIFGNLTSDCIIYTGVYSETGKMKQLHKVVFEADSIDTITMRIPAADVTETDIAKIFFLDAENGIKPLFTSITFSPLMARVRLGGIVADTFKYGGYDTNELFFVIKDTYGNEYWEDNFDRYEDLYLFAPEDINPDSYFGMYVDVIVNVVGPRIKLVDIVPHENTAIKTLHIKDIDESTNNEYIYYYPSADSVRTNSVKISNDAYFFHNYREMNSLDEIIRPEGYIANNLDTELTLIDNNGDDCYDMVLAKEYTYDMIIYAENDNNRFETAAGNIFTFEFEDTYAQVLLYDSNGNTISFDSFLEGDVIAYISNDGSTSKNSYEWIEIINYGEAEKVTGTVDKITEDYVYINGVEYINVSAGTLQAGDKGIFHIANNKVFYCEPIIE